MSHAARESLRAGLQLGLVALLATALMGGTYALTRERIAAAEQREQIQALQLVLPAQRHDNRPLDDRLQVSAPAWLGLEQATVLRASLRGQPSALVLEAMAPDGYGGPIHLLIAVDRAGRVLGVRVTAHSETPGLGDDIDADRSDWITRFRGRALGDPPPERWALRKQGGDFDQFAGATVTPRAVVRAVKRCLGFVARHGDALRAAAPGTTLRFDSAPEASP